MYLAQTHQMDKHAEKLIEMSSVQKSYGNFIEEGLCFLNKAEDLQRGMKKYSDETFHCVMELYLQATSSLMHGKYWEKAKAALVAAFKFLRFYEKQAAPLHLDFVKVIVLESN